MDGTIVSARHSAQYYERRKRLRYLAYLDGQDNFHAVVRAISNRLVLAGGPAQIAKPDLVKDTRLDERTIERHQATAKKRGLFTIKKCGNANGKRGGGASLYAFAGEPFVVKVIFNRQVHSTPTVRSDKRRKSYVLTTLEGTASGEAGRKGKKVYLGPEDERFTWRQVKRKVCCARSKCVGHCAWYANVVIPRVIVKAEEIASDSEYSCDTRRCSYAGTSIYPCYGSHGPRLTPFQKRWLSPSQRLMGFAVECGYAPLQRADIFRLVKRTGYAALLNNQLSYNFLSRLSDPTYSDDFETQVGGCGAAPWANERKPEPYFVEYEDRHGRIRRKMGFAYAHLKRLVSNKGGLFDKEWGAYLEDLANAV